MAVSFSMGMFERIGMSFILFYYAFKYDLYEQNQILKLCINMYFIGTCMYFAFISLSAEFATRSPSFSIPSFYSTAPFVKARKLKR